MAYKDKSNAIKYNNEFNKQAYDRINLTVKKGKKEIIQAAAQYTGESVNTFINRLIDTELERIERDGGGISHFTDGAENLALRKNLCKFKNCDKNYACERLE